MREERDVGVSQPTDRLYLPSLFLPKYDKKRNRLTLRYLLFRHWLNGGESSDNDTGVLYMALMAHDTTKSDGVMRALEDTGNRPDFPVYLSRNAPMNE